MLWRVVVELKRMPRLTIEERLARRLMRAASAWRSSGGTGKRMPPVYVQGVIRGLHEAAAICRMVADGKIREA